jgi:hypothetical protein
MRSSDRFCRFASHLREVLTMRNAASRLVAVCLASLAVVVVFGDMASACRRLTRLRDRRGCRVRKVVCCETHVRVYTAAEVGKTPIQKVVQESIAVAPTSAQPKPVEAKRADPKAQEATTASPSDKPAAAKSAVAKPREYAKVEAPKPETPAKVELPKPAEMPNPDGLDRRQASHNNRLADHSVCPLVSERSLVCIWSR